jgi:hypothetical protein
MKPIYHLTILTGLFLGLLFTRAQGTEPAGDSLLQGNLEYNTAGGIDLFGSDELLQMTLRFDIREFIKTKNKPVYFDATLTVRLSDNDSVTQPVKVKARGEYRRTYCSFPPIMLKFGKNDDTDGRGILQKGTLKLVTPCNQNEMFESYVVREYLTYKLFNLVTPYSFRTRLVRINYVDSNKPDNVFTAYSFLIENENMMSERNNSVVIKTTNLTQKNMTSQDMARVAVFNYMIGNTDWGVPNQHNVKVLRSTKVFSDKAIPVAYDFDYSGFVNTVYAAPFEELPIRNVTERYYLGVCYSDEELKPVIEEFGGLKQQILGTIDDCKYLSPVDKKWTTYYINSFYKMYKHPKTLFQVMNQTCKHF